MKSPKFNVLNSEIRHIKCVTYSLYYNCSILSIILLFSHCFMLLLFFNVFKQLPDIDTERRKKLRQGNFFESLDV